ncbi:hypothetical protein EUGRSUZ_L02569 [Eucalyptus grandis]|uniref:PPM-type phosphatase domain-containing protein n=1 Tax=Eucalyptus grandis TaxID=71139 RepID=A0AAD9WIU0_EUCGR|nr:hypothetical protein EUGRSUZ_L02569 [Eucalyptus grandis]
MEASLGKMDEEVGEKGVDASMRTAGSMAVVAVVGKEEVVVASRGDSRTVLCRGDVVVPLSVDHKGGHPMIRGTCYTLAFSVFRSWLCRQAKAHIAPLV